MLSVGAFVEGELYPSWMQFFQALSCLYYFLLFAFFLLLFLFIQGLTKGNFLGMVTRVDSVTHKYFHRDDKAGS
jgi:hypothetical protein